MRYLHALLDGWRDEASQLRRRGLTREAELIDSLSDDLEVAMRDGRTGTVNLTEGAKLSGYSADYLGRLVREGKIANAGRKNAPRIRLEDLPKRPGCEAIDAAVSVIDLPDRRKARELETHRADRRLRPPGRDLST